MKSHSVTLYFKKTTTKKIRSRNTQEMTTTVREHVKIDTMVREKGERKKKNEQKTDFKQVSSKREDIDNGEGSEKQCRIQTNALLESIVYKCVIEIPSSTGGFIVYHKFRWNTTNKV